MFRNPVTDLIVVLVVALLIFGPKRLPMLGRSLGQGLKEFKDSIGGDSKDDEERPELNAAAPAQAPTAAPVAAEAPRSQAGPPPSPGAAQPQATPEPGGTPAQPAPPSREPESAEVASSERRA
jgi:sec-independent protein translocase protein TatA